MFRATVVVLAALALLSPSVAKAAHELSTSDQLDARRFVTAGPRAYDVGTEAGRYPAMGFHTRGGRGGVWSPPLKLLDGIWFGVDGAFPAATTFTSGHGYVRMDVPVRAGLSFQRTDFVPGENRGVLIRLTFHATSDQAFDLTMAAHSELMSAYPGGETTADGQPFTQIQHNLQDQAAASADGRALLFTEDGASPPPDATEHHWAAAVGADQAPSAPAETGASFRGPQDPAVICPASGPDSPPQPARCDDTAYGKGAGGALSYHLTVPAGGEHTIWFGVAGSQSGAADAQATLAHILADPDAALTAKVAERDALAQNTKLSLRGNPLLAQGIDWSKQNIADAVQEATGLQVRETN